VVTGFLVAITLLIGGFFAVLWLLVVIHRQGVRRHLPWFALYVVWAVILQSTQVVVWILSPRWYVAVYWWMEAVAVVLIVGAVRESFLRIFRGFTEMPWFRWTVSGVIGSIVVYSAWRVTYHPPAQSDRLAAFVLGSEFLFRWGIFGIALLTTALSVLVQEPMNTREDGVVTGFGIASFGFLIYVLTRSLFGTKYTFLTKYAPSVGYFGAVFLWIWVFSRPIEGFGFKELGIGPEDLLRLIRRNREDVRRVRDKE